MIPIIFKKAWDGQPALLRSSVGGRRDTIGTSWGIPFICVLHMRNPRARGWGSNIIKIMARSLIEDSSVNRDFIRSLLVCIFQFFKYLGTHSSSQNPNSCRFVSIEPMLFSCLNSLYMHSFQMY